MNKVEIIKWFGTFFILLFPVLVYFHFLPHALIILCIGTATWFVAGILTKDKPMIFVNAVSTILNLAAYINNI